MGFSDFVVGTVFLGLSSALLYLPGLSPLLWFRKNCIPRLLPPELESLTVGRGYEECLWELISDDG